MAVTTLKKLTIRPSQERILLFKTASEMCRYYHEYLEFMGFEVYCVHQVEEVLQILETIAIDILICDISEQGQKNLQMIYESLKPEESLSIIALTTDLYLPTTLQKQNVYSYPLATNRDHFSDGNLKKLLILIRSIFKKMKYIMILNDSYHDQIICEQFLMRKNYHLHSTCNGHIAMYTLIHQTRRYVDLLILDLCNRYYSGFMLLSQLTQTQSHIPVFVVTSIEINAEQILERTGFQINTVLNKHQASELPQLIANSFRISK